MGYSIFHTGARLRLRLSVDYPIKFVMPEINLQPPNLLQARSRFTISEIVSRMTGDLNLHPQDKHIMSTWVDFLIKEMSSKPHTRIVNTCNLLSSMHTIALLVKELSLCFERVKYF